MSNRLKPLNAKTMPKAGENLHPSWAALIRHCQNLGFGTIEKLKIQDGLPVLAEESIKRTKFL